MSAETLLVAALTPLVTGPVHFNVAQSGSVLPRLVVQQVGGIEDQFLDGELSSKERPRIQVAAWATTYNVAKNLSQAAAVALCSAAGLQASPQGAAVADYEDDTKLHGFRQDFLIAVDR